MAFEEGELERVINGPRPGEAPEGVLTTFIAKSDEPIVLLHARVREVLAILLRSDPEDWLLEDRWKARLPEWFLTRFSVARSPEEIWEHHGCWHSLSEREQKDRYQAEIVNADWSLMEWIRQLDPEEERPWYWWDATVIDPTALKVTVESYDWPFANHALRWLLRASGAKEVVEERASVEKVLRCDEV